MSWVSPQNDDDDDDDGFGRPRPFETSDGESLDGSFEQAHLTAGFEPPAAALSWSGRMTASKAAAKNDSFAC